MEAAREADKLAVAAIQSARNDVEEYERTTSTAHDYASEPAYQEAESAGLGGILEDLFFGSGSSGGGGSGWNWGGSGGSGWSSSRPGGFGGSSRRSSSSSRRSSGRSSRSSGGRRSGGGRF
jgi:hypothetical protein